jgi:hypothetical protein
MAVAIVASLVVTAVPADAASSIAVTGYSLNGSLVMVSVRNTSSEPTVGQVAVVAKVGGLQVFSVTPVALSGNQSATVGVAFIGTVSKVLSCGLQDEQNPF